MVGNGGNMGEMSVDIDVDDESGLQHNQKSVNVYVKIVDIERLKISKNQMLGIFKILDLLGPHEDHIRLNGLKHKWLALNIQDSRKYAAAVAGVYLSPPRRPGGNPAE